MDSMIRSNHGNTKAAEHEFYATANARGMKPGKNMPMAKHDTAMTKSRHFQRLKPPGR